MNADSAARAVSGGPPEPWWRGFAANRAVQFAAAFWLLGTLAALVLPGDGGLPFGDHPRLEGAPLTPNCSTSGAAWSSLSCSSRSPMG